MFPKGKRKMVSGREASESKNGCLYFLTTKFQLIFIVIYKKPNHKQKTNNYFLT